MNDHTSDVEEPLFILAGNGSYENRGCEAIVRGTVKILRNNFQDPSFLSIGFIQKTDLEFQSSNEKDDAITHKKMNTELYSQKKSVFQRILAILDKKKDKYLLCNEMLPYIDEALAVLSVGGDNYSLDYGIPKVFTDLDDVVLDKRRPLILWGASIGPFDRLPRYEKYMIRHLKTVTAIFARESVTVNYLSKIGITENVYYVADPAFLMDPVKPHDENKNLTIKKDAIGLNLSPLMARYVTGGDLSQWERIAAQIVNTIAKKTHCPLYLIPHVTIPGSNDFTFLENVWNLTDPQLKSNIILIPPIYDAAETKWIISNMSLFAGARTHSTIAALSSHVPTISFAYSIKAKGINRDIFGHEEYCLDPVQLTAEIITSRIDSLLSKSGEIENELKEKIPFIQKSAMNAGNYLQEIVE
jgi:colanic acid/amylovoran biosynthesis protein